MKTKGSFAIIDDNNHKILLVKRRDIPFWDLPGGTKEVYESEKDCVMREVKEETGLIVKDIYLVGTYNQVKKMTCNTFFTQK